MCEDSCYKRSPRKNGRTVELLETMMLSGPLSKEEMIKIA